MTMNITYLKREDGFMLSFSLNPVISKCMRHRISFDKSPEVLSELNSSRQEKNKSRAATKR